MPSKNTPVLFLVCASVSLAILPRVFAAVEKKELVEIFRDDFDVEAALPESKWTITDRDTLTTRELGYYQTENVCVKNGSLILRARREKFGNTNYTAARVETAGNFSFLYGEIEWRAKISGAEGFWAGLWIAQESTNNVIADYAPPAATFIDYTGHTTLRAFYDMGKADKTIDIATGVYSNIFLISQGPEYHKYRIRWTSDLVEWYVDDHKAFWVDEPEKVPQVPLQLVMNVAVGGVFALKQPATDGAKQEVQMAIDFVVVRQNRTVSPTHTGHVPRYVGLTIGLLAGALFVVILVGGVVFWMCRQHDRVLPRDSRRISVISEHD
ncbi:hypothetical protein BV898_16720 [Hypsibius exemplaris]|uniref:GH16 domain-containing protein n=1 Tax=Hypsibius exemplaris TaxID=2072580 RepID=A0A9X6NE14_HYPEX|nr:hypothetical protein BV898_16720 [Hypsibius exemplaris]